MGNYYYGTKSTIDWIFGHYFYDKTHYTWLADCFYPYGQSNPKSSNPLLIYQDLYQPWKDNDEFDKFLAGNRLNLVKGVMSKERDRIVSAEQGEALRELCNTVCTTFFYPIVYRVEISRIPVHRRQRAGSAAHGSSEYLIPDLTEGEFDVMLLDFEEDPDFRKIVKSAILKDGYLDSYEVTEILERRRSVGI